MNKKLTSWAILAGLILTISFVGCSEPKETAIDSTARQAEKRAKIKEKIRKRKEQPAKDVIPRRHDAGRLVAEKKIHDFGIIEPGQSLKGQFTLTNTGKESLVIDRKIGKSCGCTTPKLDKYKLEPGESAELSFIYKAGSKPGKVKKNVWVTIQTPAQPAKLTMSLTATIKKVITFSPEKLHFKINPTAQNDGSITLECIDNKPFKIKSFKCRGEVVSLEYDPNNIATKHELAFHVNMDNLRKTNNGAITIITSHKKVKSINIFFDSKKAFVAHPPVKAFMNMKKGTPSKATITVTSNFDEKFELGEIKSQKGLIEILNTTKIDKAYKIDISVSLPAESKDKHFNDYLSIEIKDHPKETLKVRCYGKIRKI